jgi:hypothetical protein
MKLGSLEFYARYVWPVHRVFVSGLAQRCKSCILSNRHTSLENGGICEQCRTYISSPKADATVSPEIEKRFDERIRQHIGRGRRYDALMLLSGGKDSAFILHKMKTDYAGLRMLCLLIDNGFLSPVAEANASHAAARLDTDFLVVRSSINEFAQAFRKAFLNLEGRGAYSVVDFADGSLVYEIGKKTAAEMGIPLLIGGLSWVQLEQIVGLDSFEMPDQSAPHLIFPLAVWRLDEQEIRKKVRQHRLLTPGNDSPLVTNSVLVMPMCVVDILDRGYCSFEPEFAQLVREKKTDRRLWLSIFELMEYGVKNGRLIKQANLTLSRLGLTLDQIARSNKWKPPTSRVGQVAWAEMSSTSCCARGGM